MFWAAHQASSHTEGLVSCVIKGKNSETGLLCFCLGPNSFWPTMAWRYRRILRLSALGNMGDGFLELVKRNPTFPVCEKLIIALSMHSFSLKSYVCWSCSCIELKQKDKKTALFCDTLSPHYFILCICEYKSFEKTLILGMIEGKRRRGWQRMRWLDSITNSLDMT